MRGPATLTAFVAGELAAFVGARRVRDVAGAWRALERPHMASQPTLRLHIRVHPTMLGHAVRLRHIAEIIGQLARFVLALLGKLTGRIPRSSIGRSSRDSFATLLIPRDMADVIGQRT